MGISFGGWDPIGDIGGYVGSLDLTGRKAQEEAAQEALATSTAQANAARQQANENANRAMRFGGEMYQQGIGALEGYGAAGIGALQDYGIMARNRFGAGMAGAHEQLDQGFGQARQDLSRLQDLQGYEQGAATSVGGANRLDQLLSQGIAGIENDPAYQFRLEQGQQGIERLASARGGRNSGRTMKEMMRFGQGLASDEFAAAAQRAAQADAMDMQANLAAQQNQMALAGMGFGAQNTLAGMSAQQGALGAGIEERGWGNVANLTAQEGANVANIYTGTGQGIAGMYAGNAGLINSALTGASQQGTQLASNLMSANFAPAQYAGSAMGDVMGIAGPIGSQALGTYIGKSM